MYEYGIGGQEVPREGSEAIADIPQNRTLLIEKLTDDPPLKPEIVEGLKTIEEVFAHFQPQVEVTLQKENGEETRETFAFGGLGDLGPKGIIRQSRLLNELQLEQAEYLKFIRQLKANKRLRLLLEQPDTRASFVSAVEALIRELEEVTNI